MDYLNLIKNKIHYNLSNLQKDIDKWRAKHQKVVFTNGCFDILHKGHIEYLAQAASLGDVFVIGLNSDTSVKRLKGENRPIIEEENRALMLAALQFVSKVVLFEEDTPLNLIEFIQPNVLIKGGDYTINQIIGADFVQSKGGEVLTIPFVSGYSTSNIIEKIKKL